MKQLALDVRLPSYANFHTFISRGNENLVSALKDLSQNSDKAEMLLFSGEKATGKTHLLHACCHLANKTQTSIYLDLSAPEISPDALMGWDHVALIGLDNLDAIAGSRIWEEAIFNLFNQRLNRDDGTKASLLVSSQVSLAELGIGLKDLRSRLSSGLVFQLQALTEKDIPLALFAHADQRGFEIPRETIDYLLKRLPRDLKLLMSTVDAFDQASLEAQRKLSIPFVKSILK